MTGKRAARFDAAAAITGSGYLSFDVGTLAAGSYVCSLEKNGVSVHRAVVSKIR